MLKTSFILFLVFSSVTWFRMEPPVILTGLFVETGYSADQLVRDYFIKGTCRNVDNIKSFGNEGSIGYFSNGEPTLGFGNGIIISTGDVKSAEGGNSSTEKTTSFNDNRSDPDLEIFASNVIFDATGIEFDFVPLSDRVTFRYVFASEEYCEFVGSIFNDLFGFFVSGPGINGPFENNAINVATLPISGEYVTINNVNHDKNSDSYIQNELEEDANKCGIPFNPSHLGTIEFDGFTIPLTATIDVIPCETYRIRLVIGDVGDDKLDSAVFLEAKSFDLGGEVTVRAEVPGSPEPFAYETCRDGLFVFERSGDIDISQPLDVEFMISPVSTASEGSDFEPIPSMITIPAQQMEYVLPIDLIADNLDEEPEMLRLDITYDCQCRDPVGSDLVIFDLDSLQGIFEEIQVCAGQPFEAEPEILGGAGPYALQWNTGATGHVLAETVDVPTHFTALISDACGDTATVIVGVDVQSEPAAFLRGDTSVCLGDTAFLLVELEGNPPWSITYTDPDGMEITRGGIISQPFSLPVLEFGRYELIRFEDAYCSGEAGGAAEVTSAIGSVTWEVESPTCPNGRDGKITILADNIIEPALYGWDIDDRNLPFRDDLAPGIYPVTVTDGLGCRAIFRIELPPPESPSEDCFEARVYYPNVITPDGNGQNDIFALYLYPDHSIDLIEEIKIFDRWGNLVKRLANIPADQTVEVWDGQQSGSATPAGVYVWNATLRMKNGNTRFLGDNLTVLR